MLKLSISAPFAESAAATQPGSAPAESPEQVHPKRHTIAMAEVTTPVHVVSSAVLQGIACSCACHRTRPCAPCTMSAGHLLCCSGSASGCGRRVQQQRFLTLPTAQRLMQCRLAAGGRSQCCCPHLCCLRRLRSYVHRVWLMTASRCRSRSHRAHRATPCSMGGTCSCHNGAKIACGQLPACSSGPAMCSVGTWQLSLWHELPSLMRTWDVHLLRWSELHVGPSLIEAVAATERFRTEALLSEAAEAVQVPP